LAGQRTKGLLAAIRREAAPDNPVEVKLRRLLRELGYARRGPRVVAAVIEKLSKQNLEIRPPLSLTHPRRLAESVAVYRQTETPRNPFERYAQAIRTLQLENQSLRKLVPIAPSFRISASLRLLAQNVHPDFAQTLVQACDLVSRAPDQSLVKCRQAVEGLVERAHSRAFGQRQAATAERLRELEQQGIKHQTQWRWLRDLWHICSPAAHYSARSATHPREAEAAIAGTIFCIETLEPKPKAKIS